MRIHTCLKQSIPFVMILIWAFCQPAQALSGNYVTTYSKWNTSVSGLWNIDFRFSSVEPARTTMDYFYARNGRWTNGTGDDGWYIGLQTDVTGPEGRGAIFSIWNATDARTFGSGAECVPFGGEGIGQSCRLPYNWVSGHTYRLRVWRLNDGWWLSTVMDETTGREIEIGRIRARAGQGDLSSSVTDFVEHYGGDFDSCKNLLGSRAIFHRPVGNNGRVVFTAGGAWKGGGECGDYRDARQGNNTAEHLMGMNGPYFIRTALAGNRCLDAGGGGFGATTYMRSCDQNNGNLRWFRRSDGGLSADVPGYRCLDAITGEAGRYTYMRTCNRLNANLRWWTPFSRGYQQIMSQTPNYHCLDANTGQFGRVTYMRDCDVSNYNLLWYFESVPRNLP